MSELFAMDATVQLSNTKKMPIVSVGTYQRDPSVVKNLVKSAIISGYRSFEISTIYGNEEAIGEGIAEMIECGVVAREELFISLKIWTALNVNSEELNSSIRNSVEKLKLSYVDMLLSHIPAACNFLLDNTIDLIWKAFESLVRDGYALCLGVCNWNVEQMRRVMESDATPISNLHLELGLYVHPLDYPSMFCKDNNILLTKKATFGNPGGITFNLTTDVSDPAWVIVPDEDFSLEIIAAYHRRSIFELLLHYAVCCGMIIKPEGTMGYPFNIYDNLLTDNDVDALNDAKVSQKLIIRNNASGRIFKAPLPQLALE